MRRTAPLALALGIGFAAPRAEVDPGAPPPVPEGIADARGELGLFRGREAGVVAVELSTGAVRWSSLEGEWPLHAGPGAVAVAARDPETPGALRVRFLRRSDGRRLTESPPVPLPAGLAIPDPRKVPDRTTPSFTVSGWPPPSTREPGGRDAPLRVRWEWSFTPTYGFRPPSPVETRRASGAVLVDPVTGRVAPADGGSPPAVPGAELPATFRPDPRLVYWSFSGHGASWSSVPTPFPIAGGVQGALGWEPRGDRRLTLLRWRALQPLAPVEIGRGAEFAPVIAMGGRFVALAEQRDRRERVLLHDLARETAAPLAELPPFGRICQPPFAIVGERMVCVHEREGQPIEGGTAFARELVAVSVRTGEAAWSVPIAPRILPAPVP